MSYNEVRELVQRLRERFLHLTRQALFVKAIVRVNKKSPEQPFEEIYDRVKNALDRQSFCSICEGSLSVQGYCYCCDRPQ